MTAIDKCVSLASVNGWHIPYKGEYARFSVTARTDDPSGSKAMTYVRQEQPVHVTINGIDRRVGKVPPLEFDNSIPLVVAMPGGTVMPKGTLGTGERKQTFGDEHEKAKHRFKECSPTWKFKGPGYTQFKRTPDSTGKAPTVGQMYACTNQELKDESGTLLKQAKKDGVIETAEDILEDSFEDEVAAPMNIMDE